MHCLYSSVLHLCLLPVVWRTGLTRFLLPDTRHQTLLSGTTLWPSRWFHRRIWFAHCVLFFFFFILRRMTINNFSIEYDAINSKNTFTNGDTMNGRVIVETSKEVKIQSLVFRAQGKARVCWTEHYGQHQTHVYWADEKYYDVKHHILREARQDGNILIHSLIYDTLKIIQRLRDNEPILIKCFKMYDSFCSRHWSHRERKTRVSFFLQNSWQVPILHLIFFFKLMLYFSEIHFLSLYFTGKSHHLSKAVRAKLFIR